MLFSVLALRLNMNLRHSKMINAKGKSAAEIARQNCNNDWRSDKPTLIDRFKRVCLSNEFSDVDFVFNKGLSTETVWILFICYKYLPLFSTIFSEFLPILVFSILHLKFLRSFLPMMEMKRDARFYF